MAKKLYEESNIQAIADALRLKLGETHENIIYLTRTHSRNATGYGALNTSSSGYLKRDFEESITIPGAATMEIDIEYSFPDSYAWFSVSGITMQRTTGTETRRTTGTKTGDTVTFSFTHHSNSGDYLAYYAEIRGYDADGNLIREIEEVQTIRNEYKTSEMAAAISSINTDEAEEVILITKEITDNGTYNAVSDSANGYSSVTVNVQPTIVSKEFTENGVFYPSNDSADGYGPVTVNVGFSPILQSKTEYITENGIYTYTKDDGYDGLGNITVSVAVAGEGGGSGGGYANIEFDAGLDDYPIVYENTSNAVMFAKNALSFTTKKVWGASTTYYAHYVDGTTATVGANVMDHITNKQITNSNYANMGYFYQTTSSATPSWENIKNNSGTYPIYRYGSVSVSGDYNSSELGNLVICNNEGTILYIGNFSDTANALNNRTIDVSKGIVVLNDTNYRKTVNYVKQATITFNVE